MKKILIVEDDQLLHKVYQEVLSKEGFDVLTASTGPMGLELAKAHVPDLILLDVMIPGGINGFDVLEQIKRDKVTAQIPVIIISNLDSEKTTALNIGAIDYIFKSTSSIDDVIAKVKKYTIPTQTS